MPNDFVSSQIFEILVFEIEFEISINELTDLGIELFATTILQFKDTLKQ
ncbi:hypothetical protein BH09BAC5_BH09BAC5_26790 [soil metagenome]